jgi:hypothetical protein
LAARTLRLQARDVGQGRLPYDAEEASSAVETLEFRKPKEWINQSDPYLFSFSRARMIWQRWPSEKAQ